jgi:hypothetical protein
VARFVPAADATYAGVDDEWTAAGGQVLSLDFGDNVVRLRPGGKIKLTGRRAVRLIGGEVWARNSNAEEPLRVITEEFVFTLRGADADIELTADGIVATAARGDLTFSENGGPEGRLPAGQQKFFARTQQAADVTHKLEWLHPGP